MGKNFPELLREARLKAKLTQDDLASLISDYLGTFGSPVGATIATWESTDPRKHSRPSVHDRKTLRALIASLVKAGGLAALIDADELLLAGGYAPLYSDEKDEIFPSSPVESNRKPIDNDKGGGGNEDEELPDSDSVTGQLPLSSPFYISRKMDKFALTAMHWQGSTVTIKGPRQFGKSSLLVRLCHEAETVGKRSVCLNFAEIGGDALADPTVFYPRFCASVAHQLDMDDRSNDFFTPSLGSVQCCGLYFENYLLKELGSSFLLAIDEADKIIDCTFRDDFFGMLRTWHNKRADYKPRVRSLWRRLDLALVISTDPTQLVTKASQSPFNVGEVIELADFTLDQVAELNARYDTLLNSNELAQLFDILSGHPYLIHHALYLVAAHRFSTSELINRAFDDGNNSPFGDHLNRLLKWLLKHSELTEAMQSVLHNENCHETAYQELRRAGLVREKRPPIQSRCHLYTVYFTERLR